MQIKKIYKNDSAFTLVELLIVVGLISVLIILAYTLLPKVQAQNRANIETKNIESIANSTRILYGARGTYENLTNATIIGAKLVPGRMLLSDTSNQLINQFGGSVTIAPDGLGGTANNVFKLTWNSVPDYECIYILRDIGNQYLQVGINGTTGSALARPFPGTTQISIDSVSGLCANGSNTLYFWAR